MIEFRDKTAAELNDDRLRKLGLLPSEDEMRLAARASQFAEAASRCMRLLHGGEWPVNIDHDAQLISIWRDFELSSQ